MQTAQPEPSQLERLFAAQLGATPKHFSRMTRFYGTALHLHALSTPDWAQLALEHGYSDQAHLAHESRRVSGHTPAGFAERVRQADFLQDDWDTYTPNYP